LVIPISEIDLARGTITFSKGRKSRTIGTQIIQPKTYINFIEGPKGGQKSRELKIMAFF
jgi:hypothetical protein